MSQTPSEEGPVSQPVEDKPPKKFRPRISLTILAIIMIIAGLSLGEWQVERYSETAETINAYVERHDNTPPLTSLAVPEGESFTDFVHFRRLEAKGELDFSGMQLLTARYVLGHRGYKILVPIRFEGHDKSIMTNLGWVPEEKLETYLKTLKETKTREVKGRLRQTVQRDPAMKPVGEHLGYKTWMHTNTAAMSQAVPGLQADVVLEAGEPASGKTVDPMDYPLDGYHLPTRLVPSKHVEYAATWFSASAAVFGVWLALSFRRV